jgi:type III secretion translocon protein HrpF
MTVTTVSGTAGTAAPAPAPGTDKLLPKAESDQLKELLSKLFGGSPAPAVAAPAPGAPAPASYMRTTDSTTPPPAPAPKAAAAPAPAPKAAAAPAPAPEAAAAPAPAPEPPAPTGPKNDLECLSTMQRHRADLPDKMTNEDLATLAADESKPLELRQSAQYMIDNGMVDRLGHQDGDISGKDWDNIGNIPELVEYNRTKTKSYTENYIPSDLPEGDTQPRPITASDANRELYLYSDSLPDDIGPEELQAIADGKCDKKCPPQLRAAAQFMVDHPDEWKKIADDGGKVGRGELQDDTSANVNLRDDQIGAITTVQQNKDLFLRDGDMSRDSLTKLAADESAPPEVRQAAAKLLADPLVFGMIDNANNGHNNRHVDVNDGKANAGDIDALATRLTTANRTPPPGKPVGQHAPTDPASKAAMADMTIGAADDPDVKQVVHKKKSPLAKVLDIAGKVLDGVKMAVDAVSGFLPPPIDLIGVGIGAAIGTVNDMAVKPAAKILNGTSPKEAFKQAGKDLAMDLAGSAVSLIPGGGVAKAAMSVGKMAVTAAKTGAKEGAEVVAKTGTKEGTEVVAKTGGKEGAETGSKAGSKETAEKGGTEAGERGGKEGAEDVAKKPTTRERAKEAGTELKDTAVDEAKGEAESRAEEEAEKRWNQLQDKRRAKADSDTDPSADADVDAGTGPSTRTGTPTSADRDDDEDDDTDRPQPKNHAQAKPHADTHTDSERVTA